MPHTTYYAVHILIHTTEVLHSVYRSAASAAVRATQLRDIYGVTATVSPWGE